MLSSLSWIISARKWFHGPIPNISSDEIARATSALEDKDGETVVATREEKHSESVDVVSVHQGSQESKLQ